MAGRSGIGVLVTGFSRVGALKKHAPLVFTWSTMVSLRYVVKYVKIYIWAKWDLGTPGGKHSFLQIYTDFVPNWLNII